LHWFVFLGLLGFWGRHYFIILFYFIDVCDMHFVDAFSSKFGKLPTVLFLLFVICVVDACLLWLFS
jgi:hypothetical protein